MARCSEYFDVEVAKVKHATAKAFLVDLEDSDNVWIPKSVILDPDNYNVGDVDVVMCVLPWFYRKIENGDV